jgi:hypothetical protein
MEFGLAGLGFRKSFKFSLMVTIKVMLVAKGITKFAKVHLEYRLDGFNCNFKDYLVETKVVIMVLLVD